MRVACVATCSSDENDWQPERLHTRTSDVPFRFMKMKDMPQPRHETRFQHMSGALYMYAMVFHG